MPQYISPIIDVEQPATIVAPVATAASTSAYGYTEAQANALIVAVRALVAAAITRGDIAAS